MPKEELDVPLPDIDSEYSSRLKERLKELPPLPHVAAKALELSTQEDVDISEISELIVKEQVLSAKVIAYANAAYHGLATPITDIKKAVLSLGVKEVKDIIIKIVTSQIIYKAIGLTLTDLHKKISMHCYLSAVISELISEKVAPNKKSEAFLCGLLHDIGKLLLMVTFPAEYKIITSNGSEIRTLEKEQSSFNLDHCLVGKWIAEKWNLPTQILNAIWLHHQTGSIVAELPFVENKEVLLSVMLANILSHVQLVDSQSAYSDKEEIDWLCSSLGLNKADLDEILAKGIELFARTGGIFDLEESAEKIYIESLQRAVNQLYRLSQMRNLLGKKDEEILGLKNLVRFSVVISEAKSLNSLFKTSTVFLRKQLGSQEGILWLVSLGKRKAYLTSLAEDGVFQELSLDMFFERSANFSISQEYYEKIRALVSKFLGSSEIKEDVNLERKGELIIVCSPLRGMSKWFLGIIIRGNKFDQEENRELLTSVLLVIRNAIEAVLIYEDSKKTSEALAVALTKNNEMINALRKAKMEFENLFKNSNDPIAIHLLNGVLKRVNQRFEEILGYTEGEVAGKNIFDLLELPEGLSKADILSSWSKDSGHVFEALFVRKDGNKIPIQVSSRIVSKQEGSIQSIIRDLSLEKMVSEQMRLEKERLLVTLRSLGDGVIATDKNGVITLINRAAENVTGFSYDEVVSKPIATVFKIVKKEGQADFLDVFFSSLEQKQKSPVTQLGYLVDKSGNSHPITYTVSPIIAKEGELYGVVIVFSDLTERLKMQEELFKAQKFESLALLSGGVAHDFNNILTAISGNISIAKMHITTKPDRAKEKLSVAEKAIQRAKELTNQLFSFSKSGMVGATKVVNTKEMIKESVNFATSGSNVLCEFQIEDGLWYLQCDSGQINQVLNNLIINAKEAMPEGGTIRIRANNKVIGPGELPGLVPGNYVLIEIEDHGSGIPEEILDKIFDPYFSTKSRGSGLGLSSVWNIVRRHKGSVLVRSKVGQGTVFSVYLPAVPETREVVQEKATLLVKGQGKVLIMDDEEEVRTVAKEIFEALGYEVVVAENGKEVLDILSSGESFEMAVLDLTVKGGLGGVQIVSQVKASKGVRHVLVSTGYAADEVITNYKNFGFDAAIAKPYDLHRVSEVIKTLKESSEG